MKLIVALLLVAVVACATLVPATVTRAVVNPDGCVTARRLDGDFSYYLSLTIEVAPNVWETHVMMVPRDVYMRFHTQTTVCLARGFGGVTIRPCTGD